MLPPKSTSCLQLSFLSTLSSSSCWLVSDTTRARKCHEREGVEYHFITKAAFEADIQNGKWVLDTKYVLANLKNQAIMCNTWFTFIYLFIYLFNAGCQQEMD